MEDHTDGGYTGEPSIDIDECIKIIRKMYGYGPIRSAILATDIYRMALAYQRGYEHGASAPCKSSTTCAPFIDLKK